MPEYLQIDLSYLYMIMFLCMKRNYGLDLLRIFLCLCVILIHASSFFGVNNGNVTTTFNVFFAQANAIFFMLSGYFNLNHEFKNSADIKKFYKNKIINILLPFIVFVLIWEVWDYIRINGCFIFSDFLLTYYKAIMDTSASGHMWFMYSLFGFLLSTPFLSKALHHMDDKELKILWYIALGYNVVTIYLCSNLGISSRINYWFIDGWFTYYFAGYYYRRVVANESKLKWAILGIGGFLGTMVGVFYISKILGRFNGSSDFQVMYILFCMGCLMFWDKTFNLKNEKIKKVVYFISSNTFFIYLYHFRLLDFVQRKLAFTNNNFISGTVIVLVTFASSLIASLITRLCLKPVQRLIDKKWQIKEN